MLKEQTHIPLRLSSMLRQRHCSIPSSSLCLQKHLHAYFTSLSFSWFLIHTKTFCCEVSSSFNVKLQTIRKQHWRSDQVPVVKIMNGSGCRYAHVQNMRRCSPPPQTNRFRWKFANCQRQQEHFRMMEIHIQLFSTNVYGLKFRKNARLYKINKCIIVRKSRDWRRAADTEELQDECLVR